MSEDSNYGNMELPIVTVFGAGIAGLTAAHELVERGFPVQVVEPAKSPTAEYQCMVGGLAANQFSRVRAPLPVAHPWLLTDENRTNLAHALKFRDWDNKIEASAKRYPLNQKLRFDRFEHRPPSLGGPLTGAFEPALRSRREPKEPAPADWKKYWDGHGVLNQTKLDEIYATIRSASRHYMRLFFPKLTAALDKEPGLKPGNWADFSPIHDTDANARRFIARETFLVRIVAYTDADSTQEENRTLARYWAEEVRDALLARNAQREQTLAQLTRDARQNLDFAKDKAASAAFINQAIWELDERLEIVVRGSADARPTADARERSFANRVEFEVVEQIIPGEHGFRFFPGFYRHVYDTMKRTPIFDERGATQGSAMDQLVLTPKPLLALKGGMYDFDFRNISSIHQARAASDLMFNKVGCTFKDMLGFQLKTFRFLTSGPKRREKETEGISMVEYLGGKTPEKLFTAACLDFVDRAPRALAAMSARESDARSQFSISIQLSIGSVPDPSTLNGPTSLAWLDPWKAYLKRAGVKFFVGKLAGFEAKATGGESVTRLVPVTHGPDGQPGDPVPENPDDLYQKPLETAGFGHRFVMAAQFQDSSDLAWQARDIFHRRGAPFVGPFAQMVEFDIVSGRRQSGDAAARLPERNPITGKEPLTWPSRTISGAQFFFSESYRFGRSNVYFCYTPYALTSISQYAFWRQHNQPVGQLLGQISVDLGDWHSPYPEADPANKRGVGHPAFYCSSQEVAQYTWEQVVSGLPDAYAGVIQPPRYYHLDQNMVFRETRVSTGKPGWVLTGGVRANAILRVPENTNPAASLALVPGRAYSAELRVGQAGEPISTGPVDYDPAQPTSLRDVLFDDLAAQAVGRLLLRKNGDHDIVVSPLARQSAVTLRVLGSSDAPFVVVVDGVEISVDAKGRDASGVVNALVDMLARVRELVKIERPTPDYLTLTPIKGDVVSVGVLNVDRKIELVGAPSLIVKALNLEVVEPEEGFALIRNDYQYIIDVPGQWAYRPGLRRDPGGVPEDFAVLAKTFGVKRPEIFYAHPETCPMLEYWVAAGAHMATYTRMTTMEAANESGRHAAMALIYEIRSQARRLNLRHYEALAGDFPMIYPVEDNEGDDIEYFKRLDDQLFDMGQPHLFELVGLTQLVESIQRGDFTRTQIEAKLQPLLAGVPGLSLAAPGFASKLTELLLKMWGKKK